MEEIDGPVLAPAAFDAHFRAQAGSTLLPELWARAWGEDYPAEVEPFSPCSWSLLSSLVGALRLPPGATLVDLGCGRGGPGLWLARAMNARLVGIDWSAVAVEFAAQRAPPRPTPPTTTRPRPARRSASEKGGRERDTGARMK